MTIQQLRSHFYHGKANAYARPGGYPLFYLCSDGGCLCLKCVTKNRAQILRSTHERQRDGWAIDAVDVNWESETWCDNCGEEIESAYGHVSEGQ